MIKLTDHLYQPVMAVARKDFASLHEGFTVLQALDEIRSRGIGEKIVYFYVVNDDGRLMGVLPTRRLLTAPLYEKLSEVMIKQVVTIPDEATVFDACEFFVIHKFLAFPVVDQQRRILGVVDVSVFTDEVFDLTERERMEEVFELIGFHVAQVRDASPFRAFRFRFMWLLATIASGTICALLASAYEITLAKSLVLAFFLTMVLGLGESVSVQSMTVTIQALRSKRASLLWYLRALRREAFTALLLGTACGLVVGLIVWLWHGTGLPAIATAIGSSVLLVLFGACLLGLSVPSLLHALKLDLKIAAGPVTLAATDIFTILCYFSMAAILL
jgi:magnesium transporter